MYMPTLARFTARDPVPNDGAPMLGGLSFDGRNRNRYYSVHVREKLNKESKDAKTEASDAKPN